MAIGVVERLLDLRLRRIGLVGLFDVAADEREKHAKEKETDLHG